MNVIFRLLVIVLALSGSQTIALGQIDACCVAANKLDDLAPGLQRRLKWVDNWMTASKDKAISRHLDGNYTTWVTKSNKRIYENPATGRQRVEDLDGGYFRIFQPNKIGGRNGKYLDMLGKPVPNSRQELSHFIIE